MADHRNGRTFRWGFAAVALLAVVYLAGLGSVFFFEPDEGRYTEIPREMLATRDFVLPHLNGVLYFEKPPLFYWLNAASISVFGPTPFASRLWSALLALGGLGLTWLLARRILGRTAALCSLVVLSTSLLYLALARLAIIDMTLTFCLTGTLVGFFLAKEEASPSRARWLWMATFAFGALAVLAKGLIGIVLPGGVVFLYLLLGGQWRLLRKVPWLGGTLVFLAIALPWHILAALRDPDFLWFYLVREHFLRYLTPISDRQQPFWFFLPVLVVGLLPWSAFLPEALVRWLRERPWRDFFKSAGPELFLWLWVGVIVGFFTLSKSKLIPYVLPAFPPLALLIGRRLGEYAEVPVRLVAWTRALFLASLLFLGALAGGFLILGTGKLAILPEAHGRSIPVMLLGALALGLALVAMGGVITRRARQAIITAAAACLVLFACIWVGAPRYAQGRDIRPIAAYLKAHAQPGDVIMAYRYYPQTLPVLLGKPIGLAALRGELEFGISKLPPEEQRRRFPTEDEFRALWDSDARVFCVTDRVSLAHFEKGDLHHALILVHEGQVYLLTNRPLPGDAVGP